MEGGWEGKKDRERGREGERMCVCTRVLINLLVCRKLFLEHILPKLLLDS